MKPPAKSHSMRPGITIGLTILVFCLALFAIPSNQVNAKKESAPNPGLAVPAAALVPQVNTDPAVSGKWVVQSNGTSVDHSWPVTPVHINLLPNGKFLFWGRFRRTP